MNFDGKSVVVTGGGGGLGLSVVEQLLGLGAAVPVPAFGESDAARLSSTGAQVARGVDLGDEASVAAYYKSVPKLYASIHLAGGFSMGKLVDTELAEMERLWTMNVRTAWLCCREAARRMEGEGRIVNVSAKPALVPSGFVVSYAMTKAAVASLTQGLSEELAERGIWVNAVVPSIIDTPANRASMPDADFDKWPKPEDLAQTIVFLASPDNASTRGALVPVYGRS